MYGRHTQEQIQEIRRKPYQKSRVSLTWPDAFIDRYFRALREFINKQSFKPNKNLPISISTKTEIIGPFESKNDDFGAAILDGEEGQSPFIVFTNNNHLRFSELNLLHEIFEYVFPGLPWPQRPMIL